MSKIIKNNVEYANTADTKVTQTASNDNKNYEVLFSSTDDNTTRTEGVRKTNRLIYNPASGCLMNKLTFADASQSNNGVSENTWQGLLLGVDNAGRIISTLEDSVSTNGDITTALLVRNYDTNGDQVANKGITMTMSKSGTLTYSVSDFANFRSAIGALGTGVYDISSQYSLTKSSGAWSLDGNIQAFRTGNIVQIELTLKGGGSAVANGANGFVGTLNGGPLPVCDVQNASFYSGSTIIWSLSGGNVAFRNTGSSVTLSTSAKITHSIMFITTDS